MSTKTASISFVTESGHHYSFDTNVFGATIWSCFNCELPTQIGKVLHFFGTPEIGKPLRFAYEKAELFDNEISGDIFVVETSNVKAILV